jgi:hypothetical protein
MTAEPRNTAATSQNKINNTKARVFRRLSYVMCASWVFGLLGIFIVDILIPPPLIRVQGKPFDKTVSLYLTDKSEGNKKTNP